MSNMQNRQEYLSETNLFVAEPNVKATKSWRTLEDVQDESKATVLYFEALEEAKAKVYMTIARKENETYVKLYIIQSGLVNILYVNKNAVYQGVRIHRNQKQAI